MMELSLEDNPQKLIREFWDVNNPIFSLSRYLRYLKSFEKRRMEKGIRVEYMTRSKQDTDKTLQLGIKTESLKEVRVTPSGFENRNSFRLFGDYAEIINYNKIGEIQVVMIEDRILIGLLIDMF